MCLLRAYKNPAALNTAQPIPRTAWKRAGLSLIGLILAFGFFGPGTAAADDPPPNLAKLAAHRETETEAERNEYTYRQTVTVDELDSSDGIRGTYSEVRDIFFFNNKATTE